MARITDVALCCLLGASLACSDAKPKAPAQKKQQPSSAPRTARHEPRAVTRRRVSALRPLRVEGVTRRLRVPCRRGRMLVAGGRFAKTKRARAAAKRRGAAAKPHIAIACEDGVVLLDHRGVLVARAPAQGWPQVFAVADLGRGAELLAGYGTSRRRRDAPARLSRLRLAAGKLVVSEIYAPQTSRNELTALIVERAGKRWSLAVAAYATKYLVQHVRLTPKARVNVAGAAGPGVNVAPIGRWRMATSHARLKIDGKVVSVVGRIYGDKTGEPGDAFVWDHGEQQRLPTVRGVRALVAGDFLRRGEQVLLVADGWARNYGRDARALLGLVRRTPDRKYVRETIVTLPNEFAIMRLRVVDVDHDGAPEVLLLGSHSTRILRRHEGAWRAHVVGERASDVAAVDLDGDKLDELIVAGHSPTIVKLDKIWR